MLLSRVCGSQAGRGASREGSLLHVTLQQEHDGRVALRRLFELVQRDLVVVVLIHFAEDLVHPLLWCQTVLVHLHHDHSAHHFVDGLWARRSEELAKDCDFVTQSSEAHVSSFVSRGRASAIYIRMVFVAQGVLMPSYQKVAWKAKLIDSTELNELN